MIDIEILEANINDLDDLRKLYLKVRTGSFFWLDKSTLALEDFDHDTEGELIFVAKHLGLIVGFISVWTAENFIHNLFISKEYQRNGIASLLIKKVKDEIGLPLSLKCVKQNENALNFYQHQQ